jgi:hypothetical protein
VTVRILEADLNEEVGRYLSIVSSSREQDVRRLTISTTGQGERDLFVSYVSEVPVWKSTYRLVLGADAGGAKPVAPVLQGWAIVDNTIGEDWKSVELSLVAGAPQAFIQRISQPYYVQRPVVDGRPMDGFYVRAGGFFEAFVSKDGSHGAQRFKNEAGWQWKEAMPADRRENLLKVAMMLQAQQEPGFVPLSFGVAAGGEP